MMEAERLSRGEWAGGVVLALVGAGIAVGSPLLIAAAAVPISYIVASLLGTSPPATVRVNRRFSVADGHLLTDGGAVAATDDASEQAASTTGTSWYGSPGDTITVRTTVRNTGPEPIVDLRVVDGVPDAFPVVDGSHRTCVTLESGAETTLEYDVELRRGDYEFDDPAVRIRDHTGTMARTWSPPAAGDRRVHCSPGLDETPLDEGRDEYAGQVPTDEGGSGIEFHSVREYESGDPVQSIDWRRYANTRELATVEYRAERSTRIVCVVDARPSQFRELSERHKDALGFSLDAVERTVQTLVSDGHPTGIVGLHSDQLTAVEPGTDTTTLRRTSELLQAIRDSGKTDDEDDDQTEDVDWFGTPYDDEELIKNDSDEESLPPVWVSDGAYSRTQADDPITRLPAMLPSETLVYFFTAYLDDEPTELVELLRSRGYTVHVVSPAVTEGDDTASRLEALARDTRLSEARATGAEVVDWDLDRPLGLVLEDVLGEGGHR